MKFLLLISSFFYTLNVSALTNSAAEENAFYNATVFIRSDAPDESGDTAPGFCNATLLNDHMAITAAHCVHLAYVSRDHKIEIEKGAYKYKTMPDGKIRKIGYVNFFKESIQAEIYFSQSLSQKMDRNRFKAKIGPDEDVAIITWSENFDQLKQDSYPSIISPKEFLQIKSNIQAYQFKVVSINPFSEMSLDTKRSAFLNSVKWALGSYLESKSFSRVEEGDSGSPVFVNDKIFAVVKGKATTVFSNWDAYSSVSNIACEINTKLSNDLKIKGCF